MPKFLLRRLGYALLTLLGTTFILYALMRMMPGSYIQSLTSDNPNISKEMIERLSAMYGLGDNIPAGYLHWLGGLIHGNLGQSFIYGVPVLKLILSKLPVSFALSATAFALQLLIAVPLGIVGAGRRGTYFDDVTTLAALVGISLPGFFAAALLRDLLAVHLRLLPFSGMVSARLLPGTLAYGLNFAQHMILPVFVLTLTGIGGLMRYSRTNTLDVLRADYIRTARAKGCGEGRVLLRHAFRNTLIPLATIVGGSLPGLFSGAMIVEQLFSIDGVGHTAFNALGSGDIPLYMGFCVFFACLTVAGMLLTDLLYAVADPRIKIVR